MKKISAAFLCLSLCLGLFAQTQPVKLSGGKMTLAEVFGAIESQTGLSVDYDASTVNGNETVVVSAGTASVKDLLEGILPHAGYSYSINKSHVIIRPQPLPQASPLKGIVVDSNGEPVVGAGVIIKGTTHGTVTAVDGSFSLQAAPNATLAISSIGYKSQ